MNLFAVQLKEREEKGLTQGLSQGIHTVAETRKELNLSQDVILDKLCSKSEITPEKVI